MATASGDAVKGGTRGVVIPVVLLGLLGVALVVTGLVAIARSEILSERSALRYARMGMAARSMLAAEIPGPGRSSWILPDGFELVGARPDSLGLTHFSIRWRLDPEMVAASLPGAVEASMLPETGVDVSPSCPSSLGRPATRRPDPASAGRSGPSVGILGPADLMALAEPISGFLPPATGVPVVVSVADGVPITEGEGFGILVSGSDIAFENSSGFTGLVVSGGSVRLGGSASIEGVVLAAGAVVIEEGARITGCVERAEEALGSPSLEGSHALSSGGVLGRF